jgi:photosystem II stability/assembly factor-like uncharacterized protein
VTLERPLIFALVVTLAPAGLRAQTWLPEGPAGGDVRSLAVDPRDSRVLYLGTADGVLYSSKDAGFHWSRLVPGFPLRGMSLDQMTVDSRGDVVVGYWEVAGKGGGVAASRDAGRTFTLSEGIQGQSVRALAVAPWNPDLFVAGTLSGLFRSEDSGANWQRISPEGHREIRNVESVALDPAEAGVIYAGTWHLPWKTTNEGRSWHPVNAGIIEDSDIFTLVLDPRNHRTLYATACTGIYRSVDAGERWQKIRGIPATSRRTRSFAQDPEHPDTLYAGTTQGLWLSEDAGATWRLVTSDTLVVNTVVPLPGTILLGCEGAGVLRSSDVGRTWIASNDGFSERFVSSIAFDHLGHRILAGIVADRQHGGVMARSTGGGWTRLGTGLEGREVMSLAMLGPDVLAGTDDGLFLLDGQSWQRFDTIVNGRDVHPRVTDLVVSGRVVLAATADGLLRSTDAGTSWERTSPGIASHVSALAASTPGVVLAATPLGLFRSLDLGASWEGVSHGPTDSRIHSLALLPGSDRVVFATTPTGLYKSTDQGRSWFRRGGGLPLSDITGLALHPDGRTLYASDFTVGGIFRSKDAGETWQPFTTEGLVTDHVWALALDPGSPDDLLAATRTGGLHVLSQISRGSSGANAP